MLSSHYLYYLWSSLVCFALLVTILGASRASLFPRFDLDLKRCFFLLEKQRGSPGLCVEDCIKIAFATGLHSPCTSAGGANILWEDNNSLSCTANMKKRKIQNQKEKLLCMLSKQTAT